MAKKQKEQVRYDSTLSDVKRLRVIMRRDGGKATMVVRVLMALMSYSMTVVWAVFPFLNKIDDHDHEGIMIAGYFCLIFCFIGSIMCYLPTSYAMIRESRANSKGCFSYAELLCTMPITRLSIQKHNFRNFMLVFACPVAVQLSLLNVYSMVVPSMALLRSSIGFVSIFCPLMLFGVFAYMMTIDQPDRRTYKARGVVMMILYYALLFLSISARLVKYVSRIDFLRAFSGIAGLVILAVFIAAMIIIEKNYYEKKLLNSSWFELDDRKEAA